MSFLISDAWALEAAPAAQGQDPMSSLIFFGGLFLIMYFLLIRPQSKRMKEHKAMVAAIGKGDEVVTSGGVLGKVTSVGETFLTVEVADGMELKIQKDAVSALMPKGTIKEAK
jgi:preprotein translocase subunit YajC